MNSVMMLCKSLAYNLKTAIMSLKYKRDDRVWLFGAWMGQRFADNSRFLFQYLSKNKKDLGIEHVIWCTSNPDVFNTLHEFGYEVIMQKSNDAIKWHLIAGVHVLCNNVDSFNGNADLMTEYSFGAKKIQLWHGAGIKACSGLSKGRKNDLHEKIYDTIKKYGLPGMWGKCYFIATSAENARVAEEDYHIDRNKIIIAGYPRLCECLGLTKEEKNVCDMLKRRKKEGFKVILYLPTFRKNGDMVYPSPHDIDGVDDYCIRERILWVEKKHSADQTKKEHHIFTNTIHMDPAFDINVLFDAVDLIITDYSSVSSDAIFKDIPTIEYCPDYALYKEEDRGFVNDFELYHDAEPVLDPTKFLNCLKERINGRGISLDRHMATKSFLFQKHEITYNVIVDAIVQKMNIRIGNAK